jgi:solute carrier family 25 carnitine/acylcarnitine transporter 20/29
LAVLREDGVLGFFRGVSSPLWGVVALNSLVFTSFAWGKKALGEERGRDLSIGRMFVAGSIAGAAVTLGECPVDFLKTQMQVKRFDRLTEAVKVVAKHRGITGLFQGFGATLLRNVPANACWYGAFEAMRELQTRPGQRRSEIGFFQTLLSGGIAGFAYWGGVYPVDV